jgi:hypothetical protein
MRFIEPQVSDFINNLFQANWEFNFFQTVEN